ncbi:hypothetical protein DH2020_013772 [Rehmannia glutinosa]|uniref:Uncharacterized protein n=1 Tax=Rehmannia glutinosa TaxID=99300 RepID=A0ABR0X382_REHGL
MSVSCGVECVVILGCMRWAWKRCTYIGSDDSATWPIATADEFEPIPRVCRIILAVYEPDLRCPRYAPAGGFRLNPDWVIKRVAYEQTDGRAPPYLIYLDHDNREIVLAIRGLNLVKESDYKLLLDNRLGMQMFDGGYVHHGLLKSAIWVLNAESETLRRLWEENGREYKMVFAGHSLGSGVAALLSVIVANHGNKLGGIPRSLVKCYAVAPARCMSLNLAVKYADIICSVVLQKTLMISDIKFSAWHNRCGRYPPEVRTAIPVDGRFEHIVLSCNATSDHAILWIEREAEKALESLKELSTETTMTPPKVQKLDRKLTLEKEHKDALERAVSLNIPHAVTPSEESSSAYTEEGSSVDKSVETEHSAEKENSFCKNARTNWNEVVEKLFKKNESGQLLLKRDVSGSVTEECS